MSVIGICRYILSDRLRGYVPMTMTTTLSLGAGIAKATLHFS
jgi:hypothetical protein